MSGHLLSGFDVTTGSFAFVAVGGGVALVAVGLLAWLMLRRAGQTGMAGALWGCALALVAAMFAYALLDRSTAREEATERRAIEGRAAELTVRAIAPGSALACLDEVASTVVENACEKPLFASPEAVAAAVNYVDARFSLLAASTALAQRDPSYQPVLERLRRSLEADRFGLVAHVLATRGCSGADCAELRLLHDPARVVANMKSRAFENSLGTHALAWQQNSGSSAAASPQVSGLSPPLLTTTGAGLGNPALASAPPAASAPGSAKLDFPSASSIPAVSIMTPEPSSPVEAEPRHAATPPLPPKRATAPHRQTAREDAAAQGPAPASPPQRAAPAAAAAPAPPAQSAPEPEQPAAPAGPVQHNVY